MQPLRSQDPPAAGELAAWELLRSIDPQVEVSELSAARILSRVREQARQAPGSPRWLVVAAAIAISLVCLQVAAAAVIAGVPALRHRLRAAIVGRLAHREIAAVVAASPSVSPEAPPATAVPVAKPVPTPPPAPVAALPSAAIRHGSIHAHAAPPLEAPPASSKPEVEVMTKIARELYADHDPLAALATLEPYLYLHPAGSLRPDMIVAAVQADLELDRTPEALGLLDEMAAQGFAGIPRAAELRLLRAELLVQSHRCAEALPGFNQALAAGASLRERALYGRAMCRGELGDIAGRRADLEAYLAQYPTGRFAAEAERALKQPH